MSLYDLLSSHPEFTHIRPQTVAGVAPDDIPVSYTHLAFGYRLWPGGGLSGGRGIRLCQQLLLWAGSLYPMADVRLRRGGNAGGLPVRQGQAAAKALGHGRVRLSGLCPVCRPTAGHLHGISDPAHYQRANGMAALYPVSYTHLDVYKRQLPRRMRTV